jgi:hypothetical protein
MMCKNGDQLKLKVIAQAVRELFNVIAGGPSSREPA